MCLYELMITKCFYRTQNYGHSTITDVMIIPKECNLFFLYGKILQVKWEFKAIMYTHVTHTQQRVICKNMVQKLHSAK